MKKRKGSGTKQRSINPKGSTKEQAIKEQRKPSELDVKDIKKPTKPETCGQFHGRTLLMGKKVPPRRIPLEPLYISKPYTSNGKIQVHPVDPRPSYYSSGGLEKRIIKEMQNEAQRMIEKALAKTDNNEWCDESPDYEVHKVDVKLENPFQRTVDGDSDTRGKASGSQSLNTIGEELEKRLQTQVQVAYEKLLKQGMDPGSIVERISTTMIPTQTSFDLDNAREKINENSANSAQRTFERENRLASPPNQQSQYTRNYQTESHVEVEHRLKEVARPPTETRGQNCATKGHGQITHGSDKIHWQRTKRHSYQTYIPDDRSSFSNDSPKDDLIDPWASTFESDLKANYDPWSTSPAAVEDRADHLRDNTRRSYYSGTRYYEAKTLSNSSNHHNWTYRSHSPRYDSQRSHISRDEQYHGSSREYRGHYNRYCSPERTRYRSRSRSPDYRR